MKDAPPPLWNRVRRKLGALRLYPEYRRYVDSIDKAHPLHGIRARLVGDAVADPTEYFDHYDAFAYWAMRKVVERGGSLRTLDLGSPKMMNGMFSAQCDVTSMVLADCRDTLSGVHYVRHDASDPLPFPDRSFDIFTSTVSLPLVGLARYGDRLDAYCLPRFIGELGRVMRPDADAIVSMCLGRNILNFNNGWFLDMPTILRMWDGWELVDHLVDLGSAPRDALASGRGDRFTKDTSVEALRPGDYRVVFLHLRQTA